MLSAAKGYALCHFLYTKAGQKRFNSTPRVHCRSHHLFTCNTDLRIGEEGSTVHTKRPLSQPTTNTEPDNGLK